MFNYVNPLAPVTDFTNLIVQGATYGELKTLIGDVMQLQSEMGFDDEVAEWLLENGSICEEDCLYELATETDPIVAKSVRICKESFDYKKVGTGYTTEVTQIASIYMRNYINWKLHKINVLCIQVKGKDKYGQSLDASRAAELTAYAMENAFRALVERFESDWGQQTFNSEFKYHLKDEVLNLMDDGTSPNSVSVSF